VRDNAKCVLCRRCASVCKNVQGISAIGINFKGAKTNVGFGISLSEAECVGCGQCISVCPTGALSEKDDTKLAWKALLRRGNTNTAVAVVTAQVCIQIGELLGEATGTDCSGKVAAMLRRMGYKKVYKLSGVIGVCPAWRKYLMYKHPERAASLPDDVQPWESFAASYKALDSNTDITAFTPCLAAKASYSGDLTAVLTTRELVSMWKRACVSNFTALDVWSELPEESFDELPFSVESTSSPAVVTGLVSAEKMLTEGTLKDLTAARACPGGCIMGGGAPAFKESDRNVTFALRSK
jgi:NADP-reducing hydrogenase subunit HndD